MAGIQSAASKLAISWLVGRRDYEYAEGFMSDLASRLSERVQLTTDGYGCYINAVEKMFCGAVDYAMLVKIYGDDSNAQKRYSPAPFISAEKRTMAGNPDIKHVSTSFAERQNLTMRMGMRRFTRLTNGFSKKIDNLAAVAQAHYINANLLHKWRWSYRNKEYGAVAKPSQPAAIRANTNPSSHIELFFNDTRVIVHGAPDGQTLRSVIDALRL